MPLAELSFSTAIKFRDPPRSLSQSMLETVDSYFYLGGKKACVIPGEMEQGREVAVLTEDSSSFLITAMKVCSYCIILPLLAMLIVKVVLRSIHRFYVIDPKEKLEEGIDISEETCERIRSLMPKLLALETDEEIIWYRSDWMRSQNIVFKLRSVPNLIFKTTHSDTNFLRRNGHYFPAAAAINTHFLNRVQAQEICLVHQLNLLVVPHAKQFNVGEMVLVAEEYLPDIQGNENAYELSGLDESLGQLATFIAWSDFHGVNWQDVPVVDAAPEFQGNRRIGLIDLKKMKRTVPGFYPDWEGAAVGFFGGNRSNGLIECLCSEAQIDMALAVAQRHGIRNYRITPEAAKTRRMEKLQKMQELQQSSKSKRILEGPPIQLDDLSSSELDLEE